MLKYKKPTDLGELIEQICARPALFTGMSRFSDVAAFVEGYVFARAEFGKSAENEILKRFGPWLSNKFDRPRNWGWSSIVEDVYPNDEEALANTPELFKEFKESEESGSPEN